MLKLDIQLFAVPFRKTSKTRKRMRRTHYKISENGTTTCPKCGEAIRPHRVCKACGTYKGKDVINKEEETTKQLFFCLKNYFDFIVKKRYNIGVR